MLRLLLPLLLLFCSCAPAFAQEPATRAQTTQAYAEKAKALAAQQTAAQQQAAQLQAEAQLAKGDLSSLQERLVKASATEREIAERLQQLEVKTSQLEARQTQLNASLGAKRQDLAALMVGLARLSRLPPEVGLLREGNTEEAIRTALLLQSALPAVKAQAQQLTQSLHELDSVQKQLADERAQLDQSRREMATEEAQIEGLIHARQQKLQLTSAEQTAIAGRLETLRSESATVDELIRRVASPRPAPKPDAPTPVLALRGGYLSPVTGSALRQFGQPDEVGTKSLGISYQPDATSSRIVAPARGRVMFAGPFKGYGQIVIIEHEGNMHSLIAGFGRLDVTVGQKINQGEPLGLAAVAGGKVQPVYFELRYEGQPIDPRLRQH